MPINYLMIKQVKLKRPKYTGKNRCLKCTVSNFIIATIVAISTVLFTQNIIISIIIWCFFILVIYFRGYLIPYTPEITTFIIELASEKPKQNSPAQRFDPLEYLTNEGLIKENNGLYHLKRQFYEELLDELRRGSDTRVNRKAKYLLGAEGDIEMKEFDNILIAATPEFEICWPSKICVSVDYSIAKILEHHVDLNSFNQPEKVHIIRLIRGFLPECPECNDSLKITKETLGDSGDDKLGILKYCSTCGEEFYISSYNSSD